MIKHMRDWTQRMSHFRKTHKRWNLTSDSEKKTQQQQQKKHKRGNNIVKVTNT